MPMRPRELIKILKKHGFNKVSQNGSHVKLVNKQTGITIIVPVHSKELKYGLQQAILKQAGIEV